MNPTESELLFTTHRPLLFSLAYRMLGSVQDTEDLLQEVFIAFNETEAGGIQNKKAYLCKMVTNRCIDFLKSASKRREQYTGTWLPEPLITENNPDSDPAGHIFLKESVSMAYLLLLQQLSETERAVFILKEVLQYNYGEISEIVGKSSTNCRQLFSRAKRSIVPPQETPKMTEKGKELADQFFGALASGDTGKILSLLSADASLLTDGGGKVRAAIFPILGAERIIRFYMGVFSKFPQDLSYSPTFVNGEPGLILYRGKHAYTVLSLHIREGKIQTIYSVMNPEKLGHLSG